MKKEDLPVWRDIDLMLDQVDPPMATDALDDFIFEYEGSEYPEGDERFRRHLLNAINLIEYRLLKKVYNELISELKKSEVTKLSNQAQLIVAEVIKKFFDA